MTPRRSPRTQVCGTAQAQVRLAQARSFLEVAELVLGDKDDLATPGVATSLAVLAGIAASDATCCAVLGSRSRGQNHRQAVELLGKVDTNLARTLNRLLDIKDSAHYGMVYVSGQKAAASVRQARSMVDTASLVVRRR